MAVFTTPVLDNFNRANELPLSAAAGWRPEALITAGRVSSVVSNEAQGNQTQTAQAWATAYGDCESYATVMSFGGPGWIMLYSRVSSFVPTVTCYTLRMISLTAWELLKITAGAFVSFTPATFSIAGMGFTVGRDAVGMRTYNRSGGVVFEAWVRINAIWQRVQACADYSSPLLSPGYIGLTADQNNPVDDFGGGAASPTTNADVYPTLTGLFTDRFLAVSGSKRTVGGTEKPKTLATLLARRAWPTPSGPARPSVGQIWPYGGNA
jgi:hypothetical protein